MQVNVEKEVQALAARQHQKGCSFIARDLSKVIGEGVFLVVQPCAAQLQRLAAVSTAPPCFGVSDMAKPFASPAAASGSHSPRMHRWGGWPCTRKHTVRGLLLTATPSCAWFGVCMQAWT
jgi:hypothetical protein